MAQRYQHHILLLLSFIAVFLFFLRVDYPLSPYQHDSCGYYFIGHSNLKYLQEGLFSNDTVLTKEQCAREHIVPCTMVSGKIPLFLVHTLFAAILPAGFGAMGIGQALLATAIAVVLFWAVRLLLAHCRIEGGDASRQYYYYLPVLLFFALSGSQLFFSRQLLPPILNSLLVALCLAAYLAYQAGREVGKACLFGFSISLAVMAHLSTVPFVGALLMVEGISFLVENRSQPWKNKLVQAGVLGGSILVVPLVTQVITWIPTLWIKDPYAWKFTAYYGRPYCSLIDQLWWYVRAVDSYIDYSYPFYRRFMQIGLYPLLLEGPVFFLAAWGWILVLGQVLKQGWSSCRGVLLLGPTIPIFWYTFQKSLFPKIDAVTPLGVYFPLLAGYAVWHFYARRKEVNQGLKRRAILIFLTMIVAWQIIHVLPLVKHQGGFLLVREWLDKHGEDRLVCLVRQGLGEAAGLNTWGFQGDWNQGSTGELGAWGLRPSFSWKDDRLPQFVSLTQSFFLSDHEKNFIEFKGIDINKPLVHFPDLPNQYFYADKYLTFLENMLSPLNSAWSRKIGAEAKRLRDWHYQEGIFIYQITK